jgi:hypothetical protein
MVIYLAQDLLQAFRAVDRFSISGMLQATLETEFMDTSLKSFESEMSALLFTQIYETLEHGTDMDEKVEPGVMNERLIEVKAYLQQARTATFTQFRCFSMIEDQIVQ